MDNIHAFGEALAKAITEIGGPKMEYVADDEALLFEDGDIQQRANLRNFFRMHQAGRSVESIAEFIAGLSRTQGTPVDLETARTHLHLHVVSEGYMEDAGVFRPIGPGLKAALVLDFPEYVRFLVKRDLETIGESEDVLWAIAEINTDAKMPEPSCERMPNGKDTLVFDTSMGAVYAWRYAMTHGTAICSMPHRDLGFVTLDDTPDSFAMIGIVTLNQFEDAEAYTLSPLTYRFTDGKLAGIGGAARLPNANAS